ncbi:MAG: hypothetical protein FCO83_01640 [Spiroplasma sp. WSS]|uniref:hypothetical protein n=1 Tax=unclassified Spiroplasma TaxID=2637901 RepID=UPI001210CFF8|nr:hypothetical protein [Spiroplasma endosymbiont of Lariophagus distinguendus]MBP1525619.1 hypothetical protein [Spiroplasma ixodetis]MBP1527072.1 hypothetical protein [Spiroplasma ixodetis]MBP1528262.1 hypothetical protein [Spiroplasma ixodetis]TLF26583.1 MAG: hypothetical protein FCO83_01640 [Spiroplasma sp. WSS]
MKKIILNPNICADEIELTIKKQGWEIIDKKYDFYQPYVSIFDNLNYEAKVDLYIAFKTAGNFVHKVYCYFLEFDTNNIFKISEIKSPEHPKGQMTTRVADFKYYKTTGNLGFTPYKSPISGQPYNLSHNYHSFFNSLIESEARNELNYVCILLKYDNHARSKKRLRYFVNSYKKFIKSFLFKFEKFEIRKTRALLRAEILKGQKKKKVSKPAKRNVIKPNNTETVIIEGNLKTIFDHKNMTVKVIKETDNIEKSTLVSKNKLKNSNQKNKK